jgi:3-methyladenine DNA glycosylase AlkC
MTEETPRPALKDMFDEALVDELAKRLTAADRRFDRRRFVALAKPGLLDREMIARVAHIAEALHAALPKPTAAAMQTLVASLPGPAESADGITAGGYRFWAYGEYILRYGTDDVDASFEAMIALTQRFSSEFAVRSFLAADLPGSLARLDALVTHESQHVRRWVSEGTRSRLPWGKKVPALTAAVDARLALLAKLRHDRDRYVQRSVANHLQDILKDDPVRGKRALVAWAREDHPGLAWICRHAARNLLKAGDPDVMRLFGYAPQGLSLAASPLVLSPKRVSIGDSVTLASTITAAGTTREGSSVRVDYALSSPTKTGKIARKVFRLADATLVPGDSWQVSKTHAFVHRSIRTVYPGEHTFELLVNGVVAASASLRVS